VIFWNFLPFYCSLKQKNGGLERILGNFDGKDESIKFFSPNAFDF